MSNSGLQITTGGLTAAASASPGGPYINIAQFRIGSGYNYTPDPAGGETNLHGTLLYTGVPTSYSVLNGNTCDIVLQMDPTIGPFNFGELAVDIWNGTSFVMFASCAWTTLQEKLNAVGNQAGSIWRIHARMVLQQLPNICSVTITNTMTILEVSTWTALVPPISQPSGANAVIVHEQNSMGESVFVTRDGDHNWLVEGYTKLLAGNITSDVGASATTTSVTDSSISGITLTTPSNAKYIAKFSDGSIRNIATQAGSTINWSVALGGVPTGAFSIWADTSYLLNLEPTLRASADTALANAITTETNARTSSNLTASAGPLTQYNLLVGNGLLDAKALGSLGTSGYQLASAGPSALPVWVAPPVVPPPSGLGLGQSWRNVTSLRSQGVTYFNTTGVPILVVVTVVGAALQGFPVGSLVINGVTIGQTCYGNNSSYASNAYIPITGVVPPGASYSFSGALSVSSWSELS